MFTITRFFLFFNKKVKSAICCIVKMENLYLRDWVDYHKALGFDNIILYDNNDENGEYPQMVIGDYIRDGFVIYKDVRGKYRYQLESYSQCYDEYGDEYDWIGFFDADEFVTLKNYDNVKEFLSENCFKSPEIVGIYVYWEIYGDNDQLHYENKPVWERFTKPKRIINDETHCFKLFVKGKSALKKVIFTDANSLSFEVNEGEAGKIGTNAVGEPIESWDVYAHYCFENCYIKHYNTLTIDEFLWRRFGRRSYADKDSSYNRERIMGIFTTINEMTPEKEKIVEDFFNDFKVIEDNV